MMVNFIGAYHRHNDIKYQKDMDSTVTTYGKGNYRRFDHNL